MAIDERPPSQFVTAKGTSFCILPHEYDRNVYGQCSYIANRTLIRCSQIRRKEDLAKNGGQCDQHHPLRRAIKERFERDMIILKNNCPPQSPKTRRYTRTLKSNIVVVDHDPALLPLSQWESEEVDNCYRNKASESFPFTATNIMSTKEFDFHKMLLLKKEIECLEAQQKRIEAQIHSDKRKRKANYDGVKLINQGKARGKRTKPKRICQHGHLDEEEVEILVDYLVHTVSGQPSPVRRQLNGCSRAALIGSDFCFKHATEGILNPTFPKCFKCDNVIFEETPEATPALCIVHKYSNLRRTRSSIDFGDEKSDGEFFDGPLAKKSKKIVGKSQSFGTSSFGQRKFNEKSPYITHPECARCRPFHRDFFPPRTIQRTTIPYGTALSNRPVIRPPPPAEAAARLVTLQRTQTFPVRNTTIQRIATQDRQRNRLQQEEDRNAAAAIQEGEARPSQYKGISRGGVPQQFRSGQISSATLAMNIANLPEELKNQPLGSVLRQGLISPLAGSSTSQYGPVRPRLPVQTAVRKPDTPISSSVLTGVVRGISVSNNVQRNQIASIDLPPTRRSVIPPHRSLSRPTGPSASAPSSHHKPNVPMKMIPLERNNLKDGDSPVMKSEASSMPIADFVTQLMDEGKVPDAMIKVPGSPPVFKPSVVEEKVDILRKKTRPSLPLPKLPNLMNRSKSRTNPSETTTSMASSSSASAQPIFEKQQAEKSKESLEVSKAKKEKPAPRQGQRRSSRLDKTIDAPPPVESSDPLSILAEAAVRD